MRTVKNTLLTYLFILTISGYSQTEFYSSNGKNRISEEAFQQMKSETKAKYSEIIGKEMFVAPAMENITTKQDSVIYEFKLNVKDQEQEDQFKIYRASEMIFQRCEDYYLVIKPRPTIVCFWSSSSPESIELFSVINKIEKEHKGLFNIVSISPDSPSVAKIFLEKHPFNFVHLLGESQLVDLLGIKKYPTVFFMNSDKTIQFVKENVKTSKNIIDQLK